VSASTRKGSAIRPAKAIQENQPLALLPCDKRHQPAPLHPGMNRLALNHVETLRAALREHSRSEGMPHGSVRATLHSSAFDASSESALRAQKLLRRRQLLPARSANPGAWRPRSARAKIEFRLRSVIRLAPLPVQRLVGRICPRLSSGLVAPFWDDSTKGRRS